MHKLLSLKQRGGLEDQVTSSLPPPLSSSARNGLALGVAAGGRVRRHGKKKKKNKKKEDKSKSMSKSKSKVYR